MELWDTVYYWISIIPNTVFYRDYNGTFFGDFSVINRGNAHVNGGFIAGKINYHMGLIGIYPLVNCYNKL
jgi:hypothetical protein